MILAKHSRYDEYLKIRHHSLELVIVLQAVVRANFFDWDHEEFRDCCTHEDRELHTHHLEPGGKCAFIHVRSVFKMLTHEALLST